MHARGFRAARGGGTGQRRLRRRDGRRGRRPLRRRRRHRGRDDRSRRSLQSCTSGGPQQNTGSVWYRFTAPSDGILSVYTYPDDFPADPSTIVTVHTGTCGALAEVACDDHDDPLGSYLHTDVTAGAEYRIDVTRAPGADPTAIAIDVSFDPDSPICPHDAGDFAFKKTTITFASPPGRESRVTLKARAELRAPVPDVATNGLQLLVEDAGTHAYTPVVEWSARTLAVPPGGPGTGCAPKDGWTTGANGASARYRNESNAFPPDCAPGSANGLVDVRVKRRADDPRVADVKVQARGTTFSAPIATLEDARLSLTFDATLGAGMVERCAVTFFALRCKVGGGSKVVCR